MKHTEMFLWLSQTSVFFQTGYVTTATPITVWQLFNVKKTRALPPFQIGVDANIVQ